MDAEERQYASDQEMARRLAGIPVTTSASAEAGIGSESSLIDLTTKRSRDEDLENGHLHKRRSLNPELAPRGRTMLRDYPTLQMGGKEVIDLTESPPPSPTRSTISPSTAIPDHSPEPHILVTLPCISCSEEYDISMLAHMACKSPGQNIAACCLHHDQP